LTAAVATRYSGADFVDVVNEPLHAPSNCRDALGGSGSTGWDWVKTIFTEAKSHFSGPKLLINEYGIINDAGATGRYVGIVNVIKGLCDGIGIQCHQFNINDLAAATAQSNLNSLAVTGLLIYVPEMDANAGSEAGQAVIFQRIFLILWKHTAVKRIPLWCSIVGTTWKDGTGIVDQSGRERQAMT
jgi:GH35 family endo-1,4-beta-xylanase